MEKQVLDTIKKYNLIQENDNIVIGVSGGPDSMCLLDVLKNIKNDNILGLEFNIYVAHINHMLREEANEEEEYVQEYCSKNDIKCYIKRENVKKLAENRKVGIEEAGRLLRHEFFEEILNKTNSNKIATAHNLNDKIETVLMNIIRGSGTSGLKGIEAKRDGKYIRPIIEVSREDIEKYCEENKINPKIDKSNKENIYTRNKVRNVLLPFIKEEFNPNIVSSLNRLSEIITDEQNYLEKIVHNMYIETVQKEQKDEIILDLKKFNSLDIVIKRRMVLYTINKVLKTIKDIEKIHIEDIIKLCKNNIGNKYLTPNKNIKIFIKKGKIFFISQM